MRIETKNTLNLRRDQRRSAYGWYSQNGCAPQAHRCLSSVTSASARTRLAKTKQLQEQLIAPIDNLLVFFRPLRTLGASILSLRDLAKLARQSTSSRK